MLEEITQEKKAMFYKDIQESGFIKDELVLREEMNKEVYGVNITCAWPLPVEVKEAYECLYEKLRELEGVYVYPYSQTHITILTIINFKKRINQPRQYLDNGTLKLLTGKIKQILKQTPIQILIDAPVLVRSAAFLPIYNPTREIYEIRKQALEILNINNRGYDLDVPTAIHSTILRFKNTAIDRTDFIRRFEEIAKEFSLREGVTKEIYITEELKPYMREADILDKIELLG